MSEPVEVLPIGTGEDSPVPLQIHPHVGILPAVQSLLYVLIVSLFLMTFTVQPIRIPSGSMEPTLLVGDFLLLDRQSTASDRTWLLPATHLERGDVVVFHDPVDDPSVHLVKRIIGLPGDRIHLRDGLVYRNGEPLHEAYAVHRRTPPDTYRDDFPSLQTVDAGVNPAWWARLRSIARNGEVTVPADSYFVMGDNRNDSEDSRYWGFVPRQNIVGKPLMVYFSLKQAVAEDGGNPAAPQNVDSKSGFARWERTFRVIH